MKTKLTKMIMSSLAFTVGRPVTLQSIASSRITIGMFGSGFIEMLARQITHDLQTIRDTIAPGQSPIASNHRRFWRDPERPGANSQASGF
jgi:hypothetical protein